VTDAGRRRRTNEDAFVAEPPLFAVADGMGGAQAGEVASRLAAAAFRDYHEADDLPSERRLEAIIQEANRRIYERAQDDVQASGMGTTVTAAALGGDGIAVGHVGDSRAYRIHGSQLEQLTEDHSLVGDLIRSGRLTPEEAGSHPQRSVITRALGTDPEVDVDIFSVDAGPGDVFLLCSDGLTTMVSEDEILRIVRESRDLDSAARALVKAANRRGGEDNVTVVLFAVEAGGPGPDETTPIATDGQGDADELEDTLSGLEAPTYAGSPLTPPLAEPPTTDDEPPAGWEPVGERRSRPPAARRPWRRRLFVSTVALGLVALLLLAAFWSLANSHFVGAEDDGRIAVYQGLPYDLGAGVSLYRARYVSGLRAAQLSQPERTRLFDHDLMSYDAARSRLAELATEGVP
jgi:PPM family protein phosphatase